MAKRLRLFFDGLLFTNVDTLLLQDIFLPKNYIKGTDIVNGKLLSSAMS